MIDHILIADVFVTHLVVFENKLAHKLSELLMLLNEIRSRVFLLFKALSNLVLSYGKRVCK